MDFWLVHIVCRHWRKEIFPRILRTNIICISLWLSRPYHICCCENTRIERFYMRPAIPCIILIISGKLALGIKYSPYRTPCTRNKILESQIISWIISLRWFDRQDHLIELPFFEYSLLQWFCDNPVPCTIESTCLIDFFEPAAHIHSTR